MSMQGIVKYVLSGDTIVVKGKSNSQGTTFVSPPERTLAISEVISPKLARKDTQDEPFAFTSREITRKLLIGQEVTFTVLPTQGQASQGQTQQQQRELAKVFLNGQNLAHVLLTLGAVRLRENAKDETIEEMKLFQQTAMDEQIGIWSQESPDDKIRNIKWEVENPKVLLDQSKGKPIDAIVERVRDGSTLQLQLLPSFQQIVLLISGVKAPIYRKDVPGQQDLIEVYAPEAKYFTEYRLLHRDVKVILEGIQNKNFVGSILFPKGNIAEALVREGLAKVSDSTISLVTNGAKTLRDLENQGKQNRLRIWKNFVPKEEPERQAYTAKVTRIINAETIQVALPSGEEKKLTLSSIRSVKGKEPKDVYYQNEGKEFLRKRLIGKKVHVTIDYIKPAEGEYEQKICATIKIGERNIAEELIAAGLATPIRHKFDDENRSPFYDLLKIAEETAIKNKKGIHNPQDPPTITVGDLSESASKAKQFLPRLTRQGRVGAVVEHVFNGSRLKIWVPRDNFKATFILTGVYCGRVSKDSNEPFAVEATNFTTSKCLQYDVEVDFESLDKNGAFIGNVYLDEGNLGVRLLEEGFAELNAASADQSSHVNAFYTAELKAKANKKGLWKDYQEIKKEEVKHETQPTQELYRVIVSEILEDGQFYTQPVGDNLQSLENLMKELQLHHSSQSNLEYHPKKGDLCSAQLKKDSKWYRARITKIVNDKAEVFCVDYGNSEIVPVSKLRLLPSHFSTFPPQANLFSLAFVNLPKDEDYREEAREMFSQISKGKTLVAEVFNKMDKAVQVVLHEDSVKDIRDSINGQLLLEGLALIDKRAPRRFQQQISALTECQDDAKRSRVMIWRYGDITEDDDAEFGTKRRK